MLKMQNLKTVKTNVTEISEFLWDVPRRFLDWGTRSPPHPRFRRPWVAFNNSREFFFIADRKIITAGTAIYFW